MDKNLCPECGNALIWTKEGYQCEFCHTHWQKLALCPDCHQPLEKLQACGAANYWCHQCNELKSKSSIEIKWHSLIL